MITDADTNFVYFSDLLRMKPEFREFHRQLTEILNKHKINHDYLPETHDIWCRDYMPVQTGEHTFVDFRYDPDYLMNKSGRLAKTYADMVCDAIGLRAVKSDILLDGGNVIKSRNSVVMTDKILRENRGRYSAERLTAQLAVVFGTDRIILIPWDKDDEYGHADGMIRFVDDKNVLINGYFRDMEPEWQDLFFNALSSAGLHYTEVSFDVHLPNEELNWGYLNFLQTENLLLIPRFGIAEDKPALEQISRAFPDYASRGQIETIDSRVLIERGGVLNCISWNIRLQAR